MNIRRALVFLSLLLGCTKPSRDDSADSAASPVPAQAAQPPSEILVEEAEEAEEVEESVAMLPSDDHATQMARERMITVHLQGRDITDPAVIAAMRRVPRHELVTPAQRTLAYSDQPLPIGHGQTISQPYIVALMTQLARLKPGCTALDVGTGSGYQAAVLAEMGAKVYSIEIVPELAQQARDRLLRLGYGQIEIRCGDGYRGWPELAPFDVIIVAAAPDHIPQPLIDQLAPGGHLVIPVGDYYQSLIVVEKLIDGSTRERSVTAVAFVPMTGEAQKQPAK